MTASPELLAVLGVVVAGGLVWLFRNGQPLAKVAAVIVAIYMTAAVMNWAATDRAIHPMDTAEGLAFAATIAAGLLVLRFASWAIPLLIVAGCVILVSDLGATITTVVTR